MIIIHGLPPNFKKIKEEFDPSSNIVFAYGDKLYVQDGRPIPPDLMIHEQVHQRQQKKDPETWWDRYISDIPFRLSQEIEAYKEQMKWVKARVKDREAINRLRHHLASDLSSPIYNSIITYSEALKQIK